MSNIHVCEMQGITFEKDRRATNRSLGMTICSLGSDLCISYPSLAIAGEHRKRRPPRAHKQEAVSGWLNPHPLGTMSAFGYIENLA